MSATRDRHLEYPVSFGGKDRGEDEVGQYRRHHYHLQPKVEKGLSTSSFAEGQVIRPAYSAGPLIPCLEVTGAHQRWPVGM